ncbi:MAG: hypothetical protein ACOCVF_02980 [bacterium]
MVPKLSDELLHLLGYLDRDQWIDAFQGGMGLDHGELADIKELVEERYKLNLNIPKDIME